MRMRPSPQPRSKTTSEGFTMAKASMRSTTAWGLGKSGARVSGLVNFWAYNDAEESRPKGKIRKEKKVVARMFYWEDAVTCLTGFIFTIRDMISLHAVHR